MRCVVASVVLLSIVAGATEPRDDLKPLAQRRQQHRRTLDGRLCAAAFVFDRQTHTGCSDSSNPAGEHGREWCYVDAQLLGGGRGEPAWGYCAPAVDYEALRVEARNLFASKIEEVRGSIATMQKAQRAAEQALDMYERSCGAPAAA